MKSLLIALVFTMVACAGGKATVKFDKLKYPVSMSAFAFDKDGKVLVKNKHLETLGTFELKQRSWTTFYSLISLSDLSEMPDGINTEIEKAKGQGAINLVVSSDNCGWNYLPYLSIIPFYPGCSLVTITGEVVRKK